MSSVGGTRGVEEAQRTNLLNYHCNVLPICIWMWNRWSRLASGAHCEVGSLFVLREIEASSLLARSVSLCMREETVSLLYGPEGVLVTSDVAVRERWHTWSGMCVPHSLQATSFVGFAGPEDPLAEEETTTQFQMLARRPSTLFPTPRKIVSRSFVPVARRACSCGYWLSSRR